MRDFRNFSADSRAVFDFSNRITGEPSTGTTIETRTKAKTKLRFDYTPLLLVRQTRVSDRLLRGACFARPTLPPLYKTVRSVRVIPRGIRETVPRSS